MIEPDHQDVHSSLVEYYDAKAQITTRQSSGDILIHHPTNETVLAMVATSRARKIPYMSNEGAQVHGDRIMISGQNICSLDQIGLTGKHHVENVCAAITAAWQYSQDVDSFTRAIAKFKGLPHRMEFVRSLNNVEYFNDSQGTLKGPVIAALQTFEGRPRVLIFGGYDKGIDVSEVFLELGANDTVLLVGDSTQMYEQKLAGSPFTIIALGKEVSMDEIVLRAQKESQQGGVVLLSPGHASFDMFKSYVDRGDQFRAAVNSLSS
jgi:UDP-N-acetylmuramoylalanine--D-glutamate ligase